MDSLYYKGKLTGIQAGDKIKLWKKQEESYVTFERDERIIRWEASDRVPMSPDKQEFSKWCRFIAASLRLNITISMERIPGESHVIAHATFCAPPKE